MSNQPDNSDSTPPSLFIKYLTRRQKKFLMHQLYGTTPPPESTNKDDDTETQSDDGTETQSDEDYTPSVEEGSEYDDEDEDDDCEYDEEDEDVSEDIQALMAEAADITGGGDGHNFFSSVFTSPPPTGPTSLVQQPQHTQLMIVLPMHSFSQQEDKCCNNSVELAEPPNPSRKRARREETDFLRSLTQEERNYWNGLPVTEKDTFLEKDREIKDAGKGMGQAIVPMRFKFLKSDMDSASKSLIIAKLDQFQAMNPGSGEYFKLRNWLRAAARLPLGCYNPLPVTPKDAPHTIAKYLSGVRHTLDNKVYGHDETKHQVMRILAQWVSNPNSCGHCIGIVGPPGTGKTSLVKEGICKALKMPFGFIALGGAADGSFLEGHGFTYEGSVYGKISEVLMKSQCMNPVLFFDELDKVSATRRGDEIIGILTHLTDSSQNERFQDRYFGELELNLSKALVVFSFNDESAINPILKDRMITIRVKGYNSKDKLRIAKDYLLPEILKQYNMSADKIIFPSRIIEYIIERVSEEDGVRNLKRGLESVVSWINMHQYLPEEDSEPITFPLEITEEHVQKYLRPEDGPERIRDDIARMMYI